MSKEMDIVTDLGIDMDGVLLRVEPDWSDYVNERHDEHGHPRLLDSNWATWSEPFDVCAICSREFIGLPEYVASAPLIEGAADALRAMARHLRLHLISHRHTSLTWAGIDMLERNGVYRLFSSVTWDWTPKLDTCRALGVQVLLDDSPKNIAEMADTDVMPIIFDRPYNQDSRGYRVYSWLEMQEIVELRLIDNLLHMHRSGCVLI